MANIVSKEIKLRIIKFNDSLKSRKKEFKRKEHLIKEFKNDFPIENIESLDFDEYVIGKQNNNAFCYRLERKLGIVGGMRGSYSPIFGVYHGVLGKDTEKKNRFTKKYGESLNEAFSNVKKEIVHLLKAGSVGDNIFIDKSKIANLFKYKLLGTYYHEKYLNIYSDEHLKHFFEMLDLEFRDSMIVSLEALLEYKNNLEIACDWSNLEFNSFLYSNWHPPSKEDLKMMSAFDKKKVGLVDFEITNATKKTEPDKKGKPGKINFEKKNRRNSLIGQLGEKIVLDFEKNELSNTNYKPVHISQTDDSVGYDILSYDKNGKEKYIEVKSTTRKPGDISFFITQNELDKANILDNHYIYLVFEVDSKYPKIWRQKEPFKKHKDKFIISPINYKVEICVK